VSSYDPPKVGGPLTHAAPLWLRRSRVGRPGYWYIPLRHDLGLFHTNHKDVKTTLQWELRDRFG